MNDIILYEPLNLTNSSYKAHNFIYMNTLVFDLVGLSCWHKRLFCFS